MRILILATSGMLAVGAVMTESRAASNDAMAICLASWDAGTHMSKGEWKAACKRSVKEFPSVFVRASQ